MGIIENQWRFSVSRRKALASLAGVFAASPLLKAQIDPHPLAEHRRVLSLNELIDAFDFEAVCYRNMSVESYDYMAHGDGSEWNLRRNRQVFDWVDIVQGKAVDPQSIDLSCEILGVKMPYPIFVAPSSGQGQLHPDGEAGMYRGATAANTLACFASGTTVPHQKLAAASTGPRWNQFYPIPDLGASAKQLQMFQDLGGRAIVITVDQQTSLYERDLHDRNLGGSVNSGRGGGGGGNAAAAAAASGKPAPMTGSGERGIGKFPQWSKYRVPNRRSWYTWEYIDEVRKFLKVPIVVKGIVTAEDAELCVKNGVDGLVVSNHGGRSMDYGPSTLEVLPEIVAAVNGKIPVLIDSGFRRGSDIFKALALGANAVALGRAARWGLGAYGAEGVQRLLEVLQAELVHAAAYAGRASLKAIDKTAVKANFV
jgi:isopentenyl diphosphate isomerase/L-lactate dehydrogenase-like FMN-dependent dehydrogenase